MFPHPVVLFDGVCNFCNGSVQFILKYDRSRSIHFASLQSEEARVLLAPFGKAAEDMYSILLIHNGRLYDRTSAALRVGRIMGGLLRVVAWIVWLIPRPLRNWMYDRFAANRYRLFGKKKETCRMPKPAERGRFLTLQQLQPLQMQDLAGSIS